MPKIHHDSGRTIYRTERKFLVTGSVFLIMGTLVIVGLSIGKLMEPSGSRNPGRNEYPPWVFIAPFALMPMMGLAMTLYGKNKRYEVDDLGLRYFDGRGNKTSEVEWGAIKSLEQVNTTLELPVPIFGQTSERTELIVATLAGQVSVLPNFPGWPLLEAEIEYRLPQLKSPIGKAARELTRNRPEIPPSGLVFRPTPPFLIGGFPLAIGLLCICGALFTGSLQPGSPEKLAITILGAVISLVGLLFGFAAFNRKDVITESEIRRHNVFGQLKEHFYWSDVRAFVYESFQSGKGGSSTCFVLRTSDTFLRFDSQFGRWNKLCATIISMLPSDARVYIPSMNIV